MTDTFFQALHRLPLVAILRGISPDECEAVGDVLAQAGFGIIEVPLNSPNPLASITRLRTRLPQTLVGAGTVLTAAQVRDVQAVGGQIVVSPNFNAEVVAVTQSLGLVSLPGIFTPTEAFAALAVGATALKLFPAEGASPAALKALLAVLPPGTAVLPVGGIHTQNLGPWRAAGAAGFGIGSNLYKPGKPLTQIAQDAAALVAAWRTLAAQSAQA
jgi:2-dehydro-3-deoxyphosphogalactonate aldolase